MMLLDSLSCPCITGPIALNKILGLFLVLLQVGTSRYFLGIHTKLLSPTPGVRPRQAERRFVDFSLFQVGTALSADWMRPSRWRNSSAASATKSIPSRPPATP